MNETSTSAQPAAPDAAPAEQDIGPTLAAARQAQGLTLDDVANQLKFSTRQIEALEAGRFEQLPGGPFVRGMMRSYARLLGLDAAALLERMGGAPESADPNRIAARFKQPVPFSDSSRRSSAAYIALALVALAIAIGVAVQWRAEMARKERAAAEKTAAEKIAAASSPVAKPSAPPVAVAAAPAAEPPPAAVPATPKAAETKPAAKPSAAPKADETRPLPAGRQRIGLRTDEESWIEITDASGRTLVSYLMPGGTERTIVGEAPLSLVIGNAHRVHLTHNGKAIDLKPYIKVEVARLTLQ